VSGEASRADAEARSEPEGPSTIPRVGVTRHRVELATLTLALGLAAIGRARSFAGLVLAYVVSWLLVEFALRTRIGMHLRALPAGWMLLVCVVALVVLARDADALLAAEGLHHLSARLEDRAALGTSYAIDPLHLRSDREQTFVVRAEDASEVSLELVGERFEGEAMGAGIFRIDVDPRGLTVNRETIEAILRIDGTPHERALHWIAARAHPRGLSLDALGERACAVSEETGEVYVIDREHTVRVRLEDGPVACAWSGDALRVALHDGRLVSLDRSGALTSTESEDVTALAILPSEGAPLEARIGRRDADEGPASALSIVGEGSVEHTLLLAGTADHLVWVAGSEGPLAVVALRAPSRLVTVSSNGAVMAERRLLAPVIAMAARGASLVIATADFAEDAEAHLGNHYIDDQLLLLGPDALEVRAVLHTAARTPRQDHAGDVDVGCGPRGLFIEEDGSVLVAFEGSREVTRYPRFDLPPRRVRLRDVPGEAHAPESAVRLRDGTLLFTSPASGALIRVRNGRVRIESLDGTAEELLRDRPEDLRVRMGELAFTEATRSGVSCASCHLFGGTDSVAHNIGGRLLAPTLDVRGVVGTAPYLRDGSYPRLSDLHEVADAEYRGYRFPAGDRGATIEGYLASTVRPQVHVAIDRERARAGAAIFVRAECITCHAPPAFTDLGLHVPVAVFPDHDFPANVTALDTPSLRGLSESPPYLYDGRAPTLRAVLTAENTANRHGNTRWLSETELDALVAFLRSLP